MYVWILFILSSSQETVSSNKTKQLKSQMVNIFQGDESLSRMYTIWVLTRDADF